MKKLLSIFRAIWSGTLGISAVSAIGAEKIDFARDIQPIFAEKCTTCHGSEKPKGGLNLTDPKAFRAELKSGAHAVIPRKPTESELIARITTSEPDDLMPPPDKGKRLTEAQVQLITRWINEGAEWSVHWAYRPLAKLNPPQTKDRTWARNDLDKFILARLEQYKLQPSAQTDRHTLIKRLSYDLLGIPPAPAEADAFANDKSPNAYTKLVDRLLASPHFGERWGRHWLDKARYADSDGYEKDRPRPNAWRYRDWVINSINQDIPFDQFTIQQLAGDLLPKRTGLQHLATAFNRQTLTNTEGGTDREQWRVAAVMDRVETLGTVWLGLTVGCARCHDHKYDQLTQKEYYQLFAYFNNGDEGSASVPRTRKALEEFEITRKAHEAKVKTLQTKIAAHDKSLSAKLPEFEKNLRAQIDARKDDPVKFHAMKPAAVRADVSDKVKFTPQKDGSLLVTGENPPVSEYEVNYRTGLPKVTGIKLEVLPDKSLGANGPGRTKHGNFVLNEVRVYATANKDFDSKSMRPLKLASAKSDYSQKDWPAKNAIDGKGGAGNKGTGWAVGNQYGKAHWLVVTFAKPVEIESGVNLHIVLDQEYGTQHTIGRFRINARTGQEATDGIPANIVAFLKKTDERTSEESNALLAFLRTRDKMASALQAELKKLNAATPKPPVMSVRVISQRASNPRTTHVLHRGEFKQPRDKVTAGTLSTLPPIKNRAQGDRLDIASWLVDGQNPLPPRVAINQMWANLFGKGLVNTMNDFGVRGHAPSHPELLDWLAAEFIKRKWSRKSMIRLIVSSATYRQASMHRPKLSEVDPNNRLLHRQNRFRVEAEIVRDLSLAASGLLSRTIGGPSVFPPLPSGVAALSYANNFKWNTSKGEDRYRRGVYTFFKRTSPHPNLLLFDCPDSNVTCVKRNISNTPLAALATLNNPVFTEAAKRLGKRLMNEGETDAQRIRNGFRLCVTRPPTANESAAFAKLLQQAKAYYAANEAEAKAFNETPKASAWATVARVMLNLDEFLTRE